MPSLTTHLTWASVAGSWQWNHYSQHEARPRTGVLVCGRVRGSVSTSWQIRSHQDNTQAQWVSILPLVLQDGGAWVMLCASLNHSLEQKHSKIKMLWKIPRHGENTCIMFSFEMRLVTERFILQWFQFCRMNEKLKISVMRLWVFFSFLLCVPVFSPVLPLFYVR